MTDQATDTTPAEAPKAQDTLIQDAPALDFSTKPEGFPDNYWDAEKNTVNIEQLYKGYTNEKARADGLRVKLSKGEFTGTAPQDPKEYVLELAEELKPLVPDDDPLFNAARTAAKEAGLPKEAFSKFMTPVIAELAKLKAEREAPPSEDDIAAQEAEKAQEREAEIAKLGPSGGKIISAIDDFRKSMLAEGLINESMAETMRLMTFNADAAKVFNLWRSQRQSPDHVPISMPIDDKSSKLDIETKMAKAFQSGNEEEFKKFSAMLQRYS